MNTSLIYVNNLSLDQDDSLLCLATSKGYRIYENNEFNLLSDIDDYQDLIGSLKIALPFYKSRLICFVGTEDNLSFPENQLIIWDDMKRSKVGMIMFKDKIQDVKVTKNAIFIVLAHKIILHEIVTLKYVCTFEDVDPSNKKFSVNQLGNQLILAYTSNSNKSIIKITKMLISPGHKINSKFQMMVITTFEEIQSLTVSKHNDHLVAFSKFGNKIHIYSLEDFQLKFCLFTVASELRVLAVCFSRKSRFLSLLSYNGTDLNLNVFDLKHCNSEDHLCQCDDHDDEEVKLISSALEIQKSSYIGSFFRKISTTMFSASMDSFAYLKLKPSKQVSQLDYESKYSPFILMSHHYHKEELV